MQPFEEIDVAQMITLYWRDIPAQVIAERGRGRKREQAKIELHRRLPLPLMLRPCAMVPIRPTIILPNGGAVSLSNVARIWTPRRRHAPAALEAEYPADRVKSLVDNGGNEPG